MFSSRKDSLVHFFANVPDHPDWRLIVKKVQFFCKWFLPRRTVQQEIAAFTIKHQILFWDKHETISILRCQKSEGSTSFSSPSLLGSCIVSIFSIIIMIIIILHHQHIHANVWWRDSWREGPRHWILIWELPAESHPAALESLAPVETEFWSSLQTGSHPFHVDFGQIYGGE